MPIQVLHRTLAIKIFPMKNIVKIFFLMIYLQGLVGCCGCSKTPEKPSVPSNTSTTNQPALSGRLIFHSYSCYSCNDSKLYIYDFAANTIANISSGWTINNVMNAHFSPDGKRIVFMGIKAILAKLDLKEEVQLDSEAKLGL